MTVAFDFSNVSSVEFGVGRDERSERLFYCIPIDKGVSGALKEMSEATRDALNKHSASKARYEPAEKHAGVEYLTVPLRDKLADSLRDLQTANNLPLRKDALKNPDLIFCYFARFTDRNGKRLTALRRAMQFKGILRTRGLIRFDTDALKLVEDNVFKLDSDFDLLIDNKSIHILRPASFEFAGQLQEAVMSAVPINVAKLRKDMGFVRFASIETYARMHPRAARYVASICSMKEAKNIDKDLLLSLCKRSGIRVTEADGQLSVDDEYVIDFLDVLDRRRYEVALVAGKPPEQFRALSRQRVRRRSKRK